MKRRNLRPSPRLAQIQLRMDAADKANKAMAEKIRFKPGQKVKRSGDGKIFTVKRHDKVGLYFEDESAPFAPEGFELVRS